MRFIYLFVLSLSITCCQEFDNNKFNLKSYANKINNELKGVDAGGGFIIESVIGVNNTLTYIYSIPIGSENKILSKNELLESLQNTGYNKDFKKMGINLQYLYKTTDGVTVRLIEIWNNEL